MTPELMQLGTNEAISNALVEIAVGMGKTETEIRAISKIFYHRISHYICNILCSVVNIIVADQKYHKCQNVN